MLRGAGRSAPCLVTPCGTGRWRASTAWGTQYLDGYASSDAGVAMKARLGYGIGMLRDRSLATMYSEAESGHDSRRLGLCTEMRGLAGLLEGLEPQRLRPARVEVAAASERLDHAGGQAGHLAHAAVSRPHPDNLLPAG